MTRSPIELFWTAKNITACLFTLLDFGFFRFRVQFRRALSSCCTGRQSPELLDTRFLIKWMLSAFKDWAQISSQIIDVSLFQEWSIDERFAYSMAYLTTFANWNLWCTFAHLSSIETCLIEIYLHTSWESKMNVPKSKHTAEEIKLKITVLQVLEGKYYGNESHSLLYSEVC